METPQDNQTQKHVCGVCGDEWLTEEEYLNHTCPKTNTTPTDPAHLGAEFAEVSAAAQERGAERVEEAQHPAEVAAAEAGEPVDAPVEQPAEPAPVQPPQM